MCVCVCVCVCVHAWTNTYMHWLLNINYEVYVVQSSKFCDDDECIATCI